MKKREVLNKLQILANIFEKEISPSEFRKLLMLNEKYIISEIRNNTSMLIVANTLRNK